MDAPLPSAGSLSRPVEARNPDTVFLLMLLLASGTTQLISGAKPQSVQALVPGWMLFAWALTLTCGAGLTLAGILWRDRVTGLMVEAVGRLLLAPAAVAYAIAVTVVAGLNAALVAAMLIGLAMSSGYRVWQIMRDIRHLQQSLATITGRRAL